MAIKKSTNELILITKVLENMTNSIAHFNKSTIVDLMNLAVQAERKIIIKNIIIKYNSSGLHKVTGKLKNAIQKSVIRIISRGKIFAINIRMPDSVQDYIDKYGQKSNFYKVAGSLDSGSVKFTGKRTGNFEAQGFSNKTKQQIKKQILGDRKNNIVIAGQRIDLASREEASGKTTVKSSGGKFVVVKPKKYYFMSSDEWNKFYKNMGENIELMLSDNFESFLKKVR